MVHAQYGQYGRSYHQTSRMFRSADELGGELFISRLLLCSQMTWTESVLSSELVFNSDESQDISVDKKRTFSKRYWYMQMLLSHATCKGRELDSVSVDWMAPTKHGGWGRNDLNN